MRREAILSRRYVLIYSSRINRQRNSDVSANNFFSHATQKKLVLNQDILKYKQEYSIRVHLTLKCSSLLIINFICTRTHLL